MTSSWFFLSTLNYDARSTTHQIEVFSLQFAETAEMNRVKCICIVGLGAKIVTWRPLIAVHSITEIFSNETLYEGIAQSL